jgi:hypothetical protein
MVQKNDSPVDFKKLRKELIELFKLFLEDPDNKDIKSKAREYDREFSGLTYYKEEFSFGEKIPDDISKAVSELFNISVYGDGDKTVKHFSDEEILDRTKKILEELRKS